MSIEYNVITLAHNLTTEQEMRLEALECASIETTNHTFKVFNCDFNPHENFNRAGLPILVTELHDGDIISYGYTSDGEYVELNNDLALVINEIKLFNRPVHKVVTRLLSKTAYIFNILSKDAEEIFKNL